MPFIERVAYKHSLKEVPLDVPSQVCITRDNTQLQVDGIIYFQVTDPMRASYGSSNYIVAITQLAQTHAALGDRQDGARQHLRGARPHQPHGRRRARRGGAELGRQGAALRDQGPDAAGGDPARDAGADHRRAREARADRRLRRPASRSRSTSPPASARPSSRAPKAQRQAEINKAQGEAAAIVAVAEATADAIRKVAEAIRQPGGEQAVQLKVAQQAVDAFAQLAQKNNTMIVPSNLSEVSGLIASAMALLNRSSATPPGAQLTRRERSAKIPRPPERWMSGLSRTPGKRVGANTPRGFESRPLRQEDRFTGSVAPLPERCTYQRTHRDAVGPASASAEGLVISPP